MTRRLKGLIFDLDGVIVDSHHAHKKAWRQLLSALGRPLSDDEELDVVMEGRKRQEILRFFLGELTPEECAEYGAMKQKLFWQAADALKTIPGVVEFVTCAHERGLKIGVATCAGRNRAQVLLEQFKLSSYFAALVTGDDVAEGKPQPTIFRRAAEELALRVENLLVFEDAVAGVQAATRAGMKCVAIAANGRRALLDRAGADLVVEDFTNIRIDQVEELFRTEGIVRTASLR